MATWVVLIQFGSNSDPIAVNLDLAVSMRRLTDRTRIEFAHDNAIDVIEAISAILDQAKEASGGVRS